MALLDSHICSKNWITEQASCNTDKIPFLVSSYYYLMIKYTHYLIKLQNLWSLRLFILFIVNLYPLFAKLLFMYSIYSDFIIFIVYFAKILFTEAVTGRWSCKKGILKYFAKTYMKTELESLFNKSAGMKPCNFIKKKLLHRCFPVNFVKFFKNIYFEKHKRRAASILTRFYNQELH